MQWCSSLETTVATKLTGLALFIVEATRSVRNSVEIPSPYFLKVLAEQHSNESTFRRFPPKKFIFHRKPADRKRRSVSKGFSEAGGLHYKLDGSVKYRGKSRLRYCVEVSFKWGENRKR